MRGASRALLPAPAPHRPSAAVSPTPSDPAAATASATMATPAVRRTQTASFRGSRPDSLCLLTQPTPSLNVRVAAVVHQLGRQQ